MKTKIVVTLLFVALAGSNLFTYRMASRSETCFQLALANIANTKDLRDRHASTETRRYVFIDGGAHHGQATEHFKATSFYPSHPWEIVAFEANPYIIHRIPKADDVLVLNQAIWNEDGLLSFYLSSSTPSSSAIKEKKTGRLSKTPITVESVDFGRFLRENFSPDDTIILKLDIEGAEYEVLDRLLEDGSIRYISQLFVEFHNEKVNIARERDEKILEQIRKLGIPVTEEGSYQGKENWFEEAAAVI